MWKCLGLETRHYACSSLHCGLRTEENFTITAYRETIVNIEMYASKEKLPLTVFETRPIVKVTISVLWCVRHRWHMFLCCTVISGGIDHTNMLTPPHSVYIYLFQIRSLYYSGCRLLLHVTYLFLFFFFKLVRPFAFSFK